MSCARLPLLLHRELEEEGGEGRIIVSMLCHLFHRAQMVQTYSTGVTVEYELMNVLHVSFTINNHANKRPLIDVH